MQKLSFESNHKMRMLSLRFRRIILIFILVASVMELHAQNKADSSSWRVNKSLPDSVYIRKYDTLLHLQSWISVNQMEYKLNYSEKLKLVLAPNEINNYSVGFSYRFLELGLSFSPKFLNSKDDTWKKGNSEKLSLGFGFSMHRFHLSFDLTSVKGFYLKNSADYGRSIPDTPYFLFPDLKVGYFSTLLQYNANPKFSTAALTSGSQVQARSAWTILPTFQFVTFNFRDHVDSSGVQNETTYSTDLNLIVPVVGTVVISPQFSFTMGAGPSIGVDFFKSVALDDDNKIALSKGTGFTTGYTFQSALSYNKRNFFAGFEYRYRSYGHKFEDLQRLIKTYSYFQIYFGWRLRAPGFAKRTLDWANKVSPIKFE